MSACRTLLKLSRYPVLAAVRPTADFGSFMGKTTRADRFLKRELARLLWSEGAAIRGDDASNQNGLRRGDKAQSQDSGESARRHDSALMQR